MIHALRLAVLAAVAGFFLAAWVLSSIARNDPPAPTADGVTIMVESNGVHTGIIVPLVSQDMDWRDLFPAAQVPVRGEMPTHIAIGWGEREVFLSVPTWWDLRPSTALRIATLGDDAVMRVSPYVRPAPGEDFRPVTLSREHYRSLVAAIRASLPPDHDGRVVMRGTNPRDAYYPALGHYSLVHGCNSWVGDVLAEGGVQMGVWTPFAGSVMKWIEAPQAS